VSPRPRASPSMCGYRFSPDTRDFLPDVLFPSLDVFLPNGCSLSLLRFFPPPTNQWKNVLFPPPFVDPSLPMVFLFLSLFLDRESSPCGSVSVYNGFFFLFFPPSFIVFESFMEVGCKRTLPAVLRVRSVFIPCPFLLYRIFISIRLLVPRTRIFRLFVVHVPFSVPSDPSTHQDHRSTNYIKGARHTQ